MHPGFEILVDFDGGYIDSNLMHEWLSTKGGKARQPAADSAKSKPDWSVHEASDFFKERETSDFLECPSFELKEVKKSTA